MFRNYIRKIIQKWVYIIAHKNIEMAEVYDLPDSTYTYTVCYSYNLLIGLLRLITNITQSYVSYTLYTEIPQKKRIDEFCENILGRQISYDIIETIHAFNQSFLDSMISSDYVVRHALFENTLNYSNTTTYEELKTLPIYLLIYRICEAVIDNVYVKQSKPQVAMVRKQLFKELLDDVYPFLKQLMKSQIKHRSVFIHFDSILKIKFTDNVYLDLRAVKI
jgi:hypothetical protein